MMGISRTRATGLRRYATFRQALVIGTIFAICVILILLHQRGGLFPGAAIHLPHSGLGFEELQKILLSTPKEHLTRQWSSYYTSGPHLAGKNISQALWTQKKWQEFGVKDTSLVSYDVYLNYPVSHRLALLEKRREGKAIAAHDQHAEGGQWEVKYEASLEEDVLEEDRTSGLPDRIPTFHGYSASGNVTASYVFANYGSYHDFEDLRRANVSLEGKVALVRYGHVYRGLKVKRAQELGMVAVIIYSDPGDDYNITIENGFKAYPYGPARQPSSVQRGSVQFLSSAPGDPTTPGYPSKPGAPRLSPDNSKPSIPSIPISYKDALPLLRALNGHGPPASSFNKWWQTGGLGYLGVQYHIGPSPDNLKVNVVNEQEYVTTPIWNVIGIINGTLSDEVVIVGNHRDAWVAGGAGDPHSGSAALNEVVRSFGKALEAGWKPLRTVVFASWDGEEYALLGSTEWVEEYLPWLSKSAVAYVNVDIGVSGPHFLARASPLLSDVLYDAASLVPSPNQTVKGQTVRDAWDGHIRILGSGSDYTAFQDFAGVPSLDVAFAKGTQHAVYQYHSNYDSFDWMDRFGDPGWHYHVTLARLLALVVAKLVEAPVIRFRASDYSAALMSYAEVIKNITAKTVASIDNRDKGEASHPLLSFRALEQALHALHEQAVRLDSRAAALEFRYHNLPWWDLWRRARMWHAIVQVNRKYLRMERQFLYQPGLDRRPWFKHVVFAPGLWTGYAGVAFPSLAESIESKEWVNAQRWLIIIEDRVHAATSLLK